MDQEVANFMSLMASLLVTAPPSLERLHQIDELVLRVSGDERPRRAARHILQRSEGDMRELRELIGAWRDAKRSVRSALIGWAVRAALAMMLIGMAVKLGLFGLVRG